MSTSRRWVVRLLAGLFTATLMLLGPLGGSTAQAADCKPDSVPDEAGSGLPGVIDSPTKNPSGDTRYGEYGWSGLEWHTCDLGTGPDVTADPVAIVDTLFGNYGMGIGTALASAMTQTHAWAANPGGLLEPVDRTVEDITEVTREALWDEWSAALIVIAGIVVVVQANRGESRRALKSAAAIVIACGAVAWIAAGPVNAAQAFDGVAANVVGGVDESISATAGDSDLSNDEARGATFNDEIMYRLWCRGALGDESAGKKFCSDLYKAAAVKYSDVRDYDADERRDGYNDVAGEIEDSNESYYTTLKGKSYNRTAQGGLAVVLMGLIALIRIPAEILMVAGLLVMRLAVMFGPIFALAALVEGGRPIAFAGMKMVLASFVNVAVFGVIAAVHTGIVGAIVRNSGVFATLFLVAVLTFVIWHISKPFRSPTRLASGHEAGQQIGGTGDEPLRAVSRLGGRVGPLMAAYAGTRSGAKEGVEDAEDDDDPRERTRTGRRWNSDDISGSDEGFSRVWQADRRPAPYVSADQARPVGNSPSSAPLQGRGEAIPVGKGDGDGERSLPARASRGVDDTGVDHDSGSDGRGSGDTPRRTELELRSHSTVHFESDHVPNNPAELFRIKEAQSVTPVAADDVKLIEPEYDSSGSVTFDLFRPSTADSEAYEATAERR